MTNVKEQNHPIEKSQYNHLFQIDERHEMKDQEIEYIILTVFNKRTNIHYDIKIYLVNERNVNQNAQAQSTTAKVDALCKKYGLVLEGFSVGCQMTSAFFGGASNPMGLGFQAFGQAFTNTSSFAEKKTNSEITVFDHHYQRNQNLANERSQQIQSEDREMEQAHSSVDRIMQSVQRLFEMIANGG